MPHVFVYGTLKRGFPNHDRAMAGFSCLGRFRTCRRYPLVIGGPWFLPYLIDEPGRGHQVRGEVYVVDHAGLTALDRFEGAHIPGGYRRTRIAIMGDDRPGDSRGAVNAWTYVIDVEDIGNIHGPPMPEYLDASGYVSARLRR